MVRTKLSLCVTPPCHCVLVIARNIFGNLLVVIVFATRSPCHTMAIKWRSNFRNSYHHDRSCHTTITFSSCVFRVVMPCLTVPSRNSIFDTMRHGEHALTVSCRVLTCVNVLSRVFNVYTVGRNHCIDV